MALNKKLNMLLVTQPSHKDLLISYISQFKEV